MMQRTIIYKKEILLSLYKTLVRPLVEYCTAAWSPYYQTDKILLARIQHRFTRMFPELKFLPFGQAGVMDLGGASEQSRPDRSLQIGQRTCERQEPFRHLLREVDKQSSPWSLLETKQETVSYGPEEVLFQCESDWQMEQVASRSHRLYQCWCLQESSAKDTWCPDELLHRRTCVLLARWLHGCRFVSNRAALPGKNNAAKTNWLNQRYSRVDDRDVLKSQ